MYFAFEKSLPLITLSTILCIGKSVEYEANVEEQNHNDISNQDDSKYPYQPYGFGYDIEDGMGNKQWRHEKSQQDSNVIGSYGFKDREGIMREVEYVADQNGFRARIKTNEPGTAPKDPGHVRFEAQPVMVQTNIQHTPHSDQIQHNDGQYDTQDYDAKSSAVQKIQHRTGMIARLGRLERRRIAPSYRRHAYRPYYSYY